MFTIALLKDFLDLINNCNWCREVVKPMGKFLGANDVIQQTPFNIMHATKEVS